MVFSWHWPPSRKTLKRFGTTTGDNGPDETTEFCLLSQPASLIIISIVSTTLNSGSSFAVPIVSCPGCSRKIELPFHEITLTIQCIACKTNFVPVGSLATPPPVRDDGITANLWKDDGLPPLSAPEPPGHSLATGLVIAIP